MNPEAAGALPKEDLALPSLDALRNASLPANLAMTSLYSTGVRDGDCAFDCDDDAGGPFYCQR